MQSGKQGKVNENIRKDLEICGKKFDIYCNCITYCIFSKFFN